MMMKRMVLLTSLFFACAGLFSGDLANFVNLGFSPDGKYFMFGMYGIEQTAKKPYAEIYLVDTAKNVYVPGGDKTRVYNAAIEPGQDGNGAFFTLFSGSQPLAAKYSIDHLRQGRLLYVLLNGSEAPADLSFGDYETGTEYLVTLAQSKFDVSGKLAAAFSLGVQMTPKDGKTKTLTIGNPKTKRADVKSYAVRQVFVSPGETHLIVLVEKRMADSSVRYMIETAKLK